MSGERITRYWCDDCNCFVKKDHRCQQWDTVYMMPEGAFKDSESLLSKVTEERDRAVNLIERLAQWKDAYPESVFTPVDLDAIADREGIPIDCISAQVLRVATVGWSDEAERFISSLTENKS